MNSTNSSSNCMLTLFLTDPFSISLTSIRLFVLLLYVIWLLLSVTIKEFRSKTLAYLHNLNTIGLVFCINGVQILFTNTCEVFSAFTCTLQSVFFIFGSTIPGYGLASLALYRLACVCFLNLEKKLNRYTIITSIAIIWSVPMIFTLLQCFAFPAKFYFSTIVYGCLFDSSDSFASFIFFIITNSIIPNIVVLAAYVYTNFRLKSLRMKTNASRSAEPPRITIQLLIYICMFEYNCVANAIFYYQTVLLRPIVSKELITLLRTFRWFHQFIPLCLLYFHPVLLSKFKSIKLCKA